MKITVLGAGAAFGTPLVFNAWGQANPENPKNRRSRPSLLLEDGGSSVLIDAGPDFRAQINRCNVKNIDAVLITHGHYDHIGGVPELPRAAKILGHGIDIYASAETMNELKACYGYLFKEQAAAEPDSKSLKWNLLPDEGGFAAAGLEFITAQLPHHHLHSSLFRHKNFAYVTDWETMLPAAAERLKNLDLLLLECNNGTERLQNGHSDLFKVKETLAELAPKRVVLTHLSVRVDYEEMGALLPKNCVLAYDGMELEA